LAVGVGAAVFCAFVEACLNKIGVLTWEYRWWNTGPASLIIASGYFLFFMLSFRVYDMEPVKRKIIAVGSLFALDAVCFAVFGFVLKWI
jgi:uncharacterized BrkB/YihY/UPF0761 family membrane protein